MVIRASLAVLLMTLALTSRGEMTTAGDLAFDRTQFGQGNLPIWSELSDFESWTTRQMPAARQGDPDALLALYLLASGEPVDMGQYRQYRDDIDTWIQALPLSGSPQSRSRDAHRLFTSMHSRYFGTELSSNAFPEKYREEQSQVTEIFQSGEFNCISSALLYVIAARKLNLDIDGVLLPSHAFIQLRLPDAIVEVETTSFNGFDIHHDEAFYAADHSTWFDARELEPPSYADYLAREIVSPYDLGLFNMINQHTAEDRMAYQDRMRLAELRGHFMPWDDSAQKTRLAYYYQEFAHLRAQGDYDTARRMYDLLTPWLSDLESREVNHWELPVLLTAVQAQMADTLVHSGSADEGLTLARRLLQTRDFPEEASSVESHLFAVISGYAVDRAEDKDYPSARHAFNALEFQCLQNKVCNSGLAQVYSAWAMHYVEGKDWQRSADIYREYLLLDSDSKLSSYFITNLERVYLNWAASEEWHGEWETAMGVLNQCTQMLSAAPGCDVALEKLEDKYQAGYL